MPPYRVCVVCMGNICRSPMAETVLVAMLRDRGLSERVVVDSAGTGEWHVGQSADPRAVETLRRHGYDASGHRARQFQPEWFDERDLVLAADSSNAAVLRRLSSSERRGTLRMLRSYDAQAVAAGDLDVPDPYFGEGDGFERVLTMIEAACLGLVDHIAADLDPDIEPDIENGVADE
jgi:protein-tyrosine phosphatase